MPLDPQLLTGLGAASSIFFAASGSAVGSAHAGIYAIRGKDWKSFVPVVQAGILSIYGLVISVILVGRLGDSTSQADGYRYLTAGLANGLTCWASGWGMARLTGMLNDQKEKQTPSTTSTASSDPSSGTGSTDPLLTRNPGAKTTIDDDSTTFRKTIMALIFLEAIGLYGIIVALCLIGKKE